MPLFHYKALDGDGHAAQGTIQASDRAEAIRALTGRGTFVTDIDDKPGKPAAASAGTSRRPFFNSGRVSPRQRVALLNELAVGLEAGLNLVPALRVVEEQSESPAMAALTADLAQRVASGQSLSDAMTEHPRVFSLMQISMVRAGEAAGALDRIMASLAEFAERDMDLREKLRGAAIYPLMVMGLGLLSILVIMLFILPRIMVVVAETGGTLPLPTRILMSITDVMRSPVGILIGIGLVVAIVVWVRWWQTPAGRLAMDGVKLRLPVVGTAVRRVAVSRLARTLGTLSGAGVHIVEAMTIVRDTLGNEALARHIDHATEGIVRGQAIAEQLRETGQFPQLLIQVIAMGERTGRLDQLLMKTATSYDKQTQAALQRVMSIVPVVFILVLAVFVAFILAAALLPIMTMDFSSPTG